MIKNLLNLLPILLLCLTLALIFAMCKASDLRTQSLKTQGLTAANEAQGRSILQKALDSMHYELWAKQPMYEIVGSDYWYKQMGMNFSPWPGDNGAKLRLSYATNTFDSRVEWLEGTEKGLILGIQSWQMYRQKTQDGSAEKLKDDKKIRFILPTMHYFNELLARVANAEVVAYAGEKREADKTFDLVLCTWGSLEPNMNDQYLLYINRQNCRLERVSYTIRDNFMWTPKSFYGTAIYSDFRQVDQVWIPFRLDVYPFEQITKDKVHTFQIQAFRFDTSAVSMLYPFPELPKMGDTK
jgi:hypothetical protein